MSETRTEVWFVVINGYGDWGWESFPVPMMSGAGDGIALFSSENMAHAAADEDMLASTRGYTVYRWTFSVNERYLNKG